MKSHPKMLISLLTLCQNSCKGSAAAFSSLCDRAGARRRVLALRSLPHVTEINTVEAYLFPVCMCSCASGLFCAFTPVIVAC